jgi:zinc and cadmium transporter
VNSFIATIIASVSVSLLALIGGILLFKKKKLFHPTSFVGFAAGVMLTTAVLELLPEAIHEGGEEFSLLPVFFGILLFFFLERFVLWFHHHDTSHEIKPTAYLILFGDGIHNFIDGIAIAAAFLTDIRLGILTTIAIAAHEIPQELADLGVLVHSGFSLSKALLYNFFSGLMALAGALLGYLVLGNIEAVIPWLLGFTAGMFLYISLSDLIPELHHSFSKTSRLQQTVPFLLGIGISYLLISSLGHGH